MTVWSISERWLALQELYVVCILYSLEIRLLLRSLLDSSILICKFHEGSGAQVLEPELPGRGVGKTRIRGLTSAHHQSPLFYLQPRHTHLIHVFSISFRYWEPTAPVLYFLENCSGGSSTRGGDCCFGLYPFSFFTLLVIILIDLTLISCLYLHRFLSPWPKIGPNSDFSRRTFLLPPQLHTFVFFTNRKKMSLMRMKNVFLESCGEEGVVPNKAPFYVKSVTKSWGRKLSSFSE